MKVIISQIVILLLILTAYGGYKYTRVLQLVPKDQHLLLDMSKASGQFAGFRHSSNNKLLTAIEQRIEAVGNKLTQQKHIDRAKALSLFADRMLKDCRVLREKIMANLGSMQRAKDKADDPTLTASLASFDEKEFLMFAVSMEDYYKKMNNIVNELPPIFYAIDGEKISATQYANDFLRKKLPSICLLNLSRLAMDVALAESIGMEKIGQAVGYFVYELDALKPTVVPNKQVYAAGEDILLKVDVYPKAKVKNAHLFVYSNEQKQAVENGTATVKIPFAPPYEEVAENLLKNTWRATITISSQEGEVSSTLNKQHSYTIKK